MPIYLKYIITAALVVAVSEIVKRSGKLGALIGALPLMMIMIVIWMMVETKSGESAQKISDYVYSTFWFVLPTLPMLLVMSQMLKKGTNSWLCLGTYILGTALIFLLLNFILKKFSIELI